MISVWNVDAKHSENDMKTIVWTVIIFIVDGAWISICLVAKAVEHLPDTTENSNFSSDWSGPAISAASSNRFGVCVCVCVARVSWLVCKNTGSDWLP